MATVHFEDQATGHVNHGGAAEKALEEEAAHDAEDGGLTMAEYRAQRVRETGANPYRKLVNKIKAYIAEIIEQNRYGPPYEPDFLDDLLDECARYEPSLYRLHEYLAGKADPRARGGESGNTALHYVCARGHITAAKMLFRAGGDIECRNSLGQTPLSAAAQGKTAYNDRMVAHLLEAGASPRVVDRGGFTPLLLAIEGRRFRMVSSLLEHGAIIERTNTMLQLRGLSEMRYARLLVEQAEDSSDDDDDDDMPESDAFDNCSKSLFKRFAEPLLDSWQMLHTKERYVLDALEAAAPVQAQLKVWKEGEKRKAEREAKRAARDLNKAANWRKGRMKKRKAERLQKLKDRDAGMMKAIRDASKAQIEAEEEAYRLGKMRNMTGGEIEHQDTGVWERSEVDTEDRNGKKTTRAVFTYKEGEGTRQLATSLNRTPFEERGYKGTELI